jgi:hypothetical protein
MAAVRADGHDGPAMMLADPLTAGAGPDAIFDAFAGWAKDRGLILYPHQEEALIEVVSGRTSS